MAFHGVAYVDRIDMSSKALFEGLIADEEGRSVEVALVGDNIFYVVDDQGFHRHIEAEKVDRQVLAHMSKMMEGNEDLIAEGTMKMIGQEDIFTKAMIESSLENIDDQLDQVMGQGLDDDVRLWLGMMGFRVVIDLHGDVIELEQPGAADFPED